MQTTTLFRGKTYSITLSPIGDGKYLSAAAAFDYIRMRDAAKTAGITLTANTAYRSYEYQKQLHDAYVLKLALGQSPSPVAEPGRSYHEIGEAVDISVGMGSDGKGAPTTTYRWLQANAPSFGFKETVSGEPWHWQYTRESVVGKLAALVDADEGDSGSGGNSVAKWVFAAALSFYLYKKWF